MFHVIVLVSECGSGGVGRAGGEAWGRGRGGGAACPPPPTALVLDGRGPAGGAAGVAWSAARLWGYFAIEPFFLAGESSWPASIGAVALRTSSATFRWLASSCPAKS